MLMIGSLVFFLIEIFYRGPHALRLGWVLGLFTFAAVLVSRISIEAGLERASLFGFVLSAATLYVTVTLIDFDYGELFFLEIIVASLFVAVVMWSANRLTWDCTVIDGSRDVSSIGLAELVKRKLLNRKSQRTLNSQQGDPTQKQTKDFGFGRWLFMFFATANSKNTPGLWVFYFAIAAFPIFGFGQWFAQPSSGWGYRWIFLLFAIYLGSALGLLMLTSLLSLQRYVNKRGATLPTNVSIDWMLVGTVFALGVMLIMLLLPSPSLTNAWKDALGFLTTNRQDTSAHAIGDDGQENGDQPKNKKQDPNAEDSDDQSGQDGSGKGNQGRGGDNERKANGNDSSGGKQKNGKKNESDKSSKTNQDQDKNRSNSSEPNSSKDSDQRDQQEAPENKDEQNADGDTENRQDAKVDRDENDPQDGGEVDRQNPDRENANQKQADQNRRGNNKAAPRRQSGQPQLSQFAKIFNGTIKYLIYIIGLVALLIMLWMFREELAKLWAELFGKPDKKNKPTKTVGAASLPAKTSLAKFSQFRDPFLHGMAAQWPPAKTIIYTFQALEAWGRGHGCPRDNDQTPHEFAKHLRRIDKDVASNAGQLADLVGKSLYSGGSVTRSDSDRLQQVWELMNANLPKRRDDSITPNLHLVKES